MMLSSMKITPIIINNNNSFSIYSILLILGFVLLHLIFAFFFSSFFLFSAWLSSSPWDFLLWLKGKSSLLNNLEFSRFWQNHPLPKIAKISGEKIKKKTYWAVQSPGQQTQASVFLPTWWSENFSYTPREKHYFNFPMKFKWVAFLFRFDLWKVDETLYNTILQALGNQIFPPTDESLG